MKYFYLKSRLVILCLFIISAVYAESNLDGLDIKSDNRYCGRKLFASMKFFCQPHIKEMVNSGYFEPLDLKTTNLQSTDKADKENPPLKGLIHDCCKNQCSISTLIKYCRL